MAIKDLKPNTGKVELIATVTEVTEPKTINKYGRELRLANGTLKDDTGEIALTLWNDQVNQIKVGQRIKITNGWVGEWQGKAQLSTGRFGKLEVLEGDDDGSAASAPEPDAALDEESEEDVF